MQCPHNINNQCNLGTKVSNISIPIIDKVCDSCVKERDHRTNPSRSLIVHMIGEHHRQRIPVPRYLQEALSAKTSNRPFPTDYGPGTELKKLISWFQWATRVKKRCRRCLTREKQMNRWGPDECLRRIETIKRWLKWSASTNNLPYVERLVVPLIHKAIQNSRETYQNEMVRNRNNCPT